jgi:hypothetical protein
MKIKFGRKLEESNRHFIMRPVFPSNIKDNLTKAIGNERNNDMQAMYGEFLKPGKEDLETYENAKKYLEESSTDKYKAEKIIKAYSEGGWRKALSLIADLGIAGTAGVFGLAMFGLYTWGGPITAAAIGFGLLHALLVGAYGEVIKALLLGADDILRKNPKSKRLFDLAMNDQEAKSIISKIKKELDKEKPNKEELKLLKTQLISKIKELENKKEVLEESKPNLFDNIRKKRMRIKFGSGEKMKKPNQDGYPSNLEKIAKDAVINESYTDEDLLKLFENLNFDLNKYTLKYLAEESGFVMLGEGKWGKMLGKAVLPTLALTGALTFGANANSLYRDLDSNISRRNLISHIERNPESFNIRRIDSDDDGKISSKEMQSYINGFGVNSLPEKKIGMEGNVRDKYIEGGDIFYTARAKQRAAEKAKETAGKVNSAITTAATPLMAASAAKIAADSKEKKELKLEIARKKEREKQGKKFVLQPKNIAKKTIKYKKIN